MDGIDNLTHKPTRTYGDLLRITLAAYRGMKVTTTQPRTFFNVMQSAGSGALLGFVGAYFRYGLSMSVVPGVTIIGTVAGAFYGNIVTIAKKARAFHISLSCHSMKQNIKTLKKQSRSQKAQMKNLVRGWKPEEVVDLVWLTPSAKALLPNKAERTKSYSFSQVASYIWETVSFTTLACTCTGVLLGPGVYQAASRFLPPLMSIGVSLYTSSAFITYAIPVSIALVISAPVIRKLHEYDLAFNQEYQKMHCKQTNIQMKNRLHQCWINEAEISIETQDGEVNDQP